MNISVAKNRIKTIDYKGNLNKLIGRSDSVFEILEKSQGILKGKLKVSPVVWQRKIRKEWENRVKKLERLIKK